MSVFSIVHKRINKLLHFSWEFNFEQIFHPYQSYDPYFFRSQKGWWWRGHEHVLHAHPHGHVQRHCSYDGDDHYGLDEGHHADGGWSLHDDDVRHAQQKRGREEDNNQVATPWASPTSRPNRLWTLGGIKKIENRWF